MKRILFAAVLAVAAVPAFAQVGVSVSVGQPGFYGQIDVGSAPRPQVIYAEPRVIERTVIGSPIYLRVPPGHAKHWRKHCGAYNACGRPVYFVRDSWYSQQYVPYYNEHHGGGHHDRGHDHDRGDHRGKGHGNGKGRGHDKDRDHH
ncbi:hypothetical protein [Stenotrophobium rhamnosiphilum]|uniref:Uncharacterized protein n=1 Tax=Stenotrophobium rhamnosiphilum TaxID=2029166 RepID=A0A2T5MF81_9GAMM|nr:hypothetical protein [Stenotrophobium rhamnosiphilum]PTU31245.1 hypothetical protein CJD38_07790 [Stenotrophobium rhamnosiphilum]